MSWVAVAVVGTAAVGSAVAADQQADASKDASAQLQSNINQGLLRSDQKQGDLMRDLITGQSAGQTDLTSALLAIKRADKQQQGFLGQAGEQFAPTASIVDPAIQNLQGTGTALGRAQAVTDIINDPDQQAMFDALSRQTQNQLSGQGGFGRRSGFGIGQDESARLGLANQMINMQDASQMNQANLGMGAQLNLASLLSQQGAGAASQGNALANILGNSAQFRQQGGVNLANFGQQGLANEMNLLGQLGQAQAAGTVGAANAQAQGMQNISNAGFGLASALAQGGS